MSPAPVGTSPLSWAITVVAVALITGAAAVLGQWIARRIDGRKAEERTQASVDLHRAAFDGAAEDLEQRLVAQMRAAVKPLAQKQQCMTTKQDEMAETLKTVDHKIDTNAERIGALERADYTKFSHYDQVITRHHPEDSA